MVEKSPDYFKKSCISSKCNLTILIHHLYTLAFSQKLDIERFDNFYLRGSTNINLTDFSLVINNDVCDVAKVGLVNPTHFYCSVREHLTPCLLASGGSGDNSELGNSASCREGDHSGILGKASHARGRHKVTHHRLLHNMSEVVKRKQRYRTIKLLQISLHGGKTSKPIRAGWGGLYILMESKSRVFETGNQTLSFFQLEEESAVHKDIVQGDFEDTYK